jgi:hypothetical protein
MENCKNDYFYIKTSVVKFLNTYENEINSIKNNEEREHWFSTHQSYISSAKSDDTEPTVCQATFDVAFMTEGTTTDTLRKLLDTIGGKRRKKNKRTRSKRRTTRVNKKRQSRNRRK